MPKKLFIVIPMVFAMLLTGCFGREKTPESPQDVNLILNNVWDSLSDDEKFPCYGGDSENMTDGKPGEFSLSDTDGLQYNLLVPQAQVASIEQAASLIHGMMVNNFTCGAFRLSKEASADAFAKAMADAYTGNQWICGTPERYFVASVGKRCVVACFGLEQVLDLFRQKLIAAYPETQILYQDAIV